MDAKVTMEKQDYLEKRRGRGSLSWILDKALMNEVHEIRRPLRGRERRRRLRRNPLHDAHDGVGVVRVFAVRQLNGGDAQRPDVGGKAGVLIKHFRSHVGRRPADQRSVGGGGVELLRQTKITQLDEALLRYEQVVGLDILESSGIAFVTR